MVSVYNKLPEEELLDLRIIETYVPAFMVIMKTLAILGFIPMLSSVGLSHGSIYTMIATILFVDRNFQSLPLNSLNSLNSLNPGSTGREKRLMDSNMSVCCVLLCFIVNSFRPVDLTTVKELVCNGLWCFIALWLLIKDELPLLRYLGFNIGLCPMINHNLGYRPEIIPSAVMFYIHSSLPLNQTSMLELSVRSISFQCLTVGWYYTYKIRNPPNEECTFIMSIVRFMPVLFVNKWVACGFAALVWLCIMIRFYQEQSDLSQRLACNVENPTVLNVINGSDSSLKSKEIEKNFEKNFEVNNYYEEKEMNSKKIPSDEDMELFMEALRQNNKIQT